MNGCSSARLAARPSGAAIIRSASTHPWRNLALEEHLALRIRPGQAILYLWRNRPSVVIGRNQNPWQECRLDLLARDGALLARRPSGGGAVYHDLGNLNFTFIVSRELYDLDRQLALVLAALHSLGVPAQLPSAKTSWSAPTRSLAAPSGSAPASPATTAPSSINSDLDRLHRYLHPAAQVATRSIQSVRSPVTNLSPRPARSRRRNRLTGPDPRLRRLLRHRALRPQTRPRLHARAGRAPFQTRLVAVAGRRVPTLRRQLQEYIFLGRRPAAPHRTQGHHRTGQPHRVSPAPPTSPRASQPPSRLSQ